MTPISLTVLTTPSSESNFESLIKFLDHQKNRFLYNIIMKELPIRGPQAVVQSLLNGLKSTDCEYNFNPHSIFQFHENVIVLSDINALKQAINLKKQGKIRKLFAGPNLVVLPSDDYEIITAIEIDNYIVNSEWTYNAYVQDAKTLLGRCIIWPAGINPNYWKPVKEKKSSNILLYVKSVPNEIYQPIKKSLINMGFSIKVIQYGEYSKEEYLTSLQDSDFAIFCTKSESQGIALIEAWSTNVPTFVMRANNLIYNDKIIPSSSAPYLSEKTGIFFSNKKELISYINKWDEIKSQFSPRDWVLNNMTDEICTKKLLRHFEDNYDN